MTLGNISENSPLGQALKKSIITTNNSSNNNGREEASVVSTRTESATAVVARNEAAVKNVDQPYYLTAAFQKKQPLSHQLQTVCCYSSSKQMQQQQYDNVSPLNDLDDQQMAQYIADSLKQNEISTGQEYSAQDLEQIIRTRFPGVNDNIVRIAIDLIMNDAANMKSRVAVASNNKDFKLLISARKTIINNNSTKTKITN
jgi:hypothetical protein